jgi:hypothetical protein
VGVDWTSLFRYVYPISQLSTVVHDQLKTFRLY